MYWQTENIGSVMFLLDRFEQILQMANHFSLDSWSKAMAGMSWAQHQMGQGNRNAMQRPQENPRDPKTPEATWRVFSRDSKHDWRPKASQSALTAWGLTPPIGACPTCPALGIFTISVSSAIKWGGGAKDAGSSTLRTRSAKIKTGTVLTLVTHQNY